MTLLPHQLFAYLFAAFSAGVALGSLPQPWAWGLLGGLSLAGTCLFWLRPKTCPAAALLLTALWAGAVGLNTHRLSYAHRGALFLPPTPCQVDGVVAAHPVYYSVQRPGWAKPVLQMRFDFRVSRVRKGPAWLAGQTLGVRLPCRRPLPLELGDSLELSARVSGARDSGSFRSYQRGTPLLEARLRPGAALCLIPGQDPMLALRRFAIDYLDAAVRTAVPGRERETSLIGAAVSGSRAAVDEKLIADFKATNTLHLIAISGLHFGMIYLVLACLLRLLFLPRWAHALFSILALEAYAWVVGFSPSVLRSAIMIGVFLAARVCNREMHPVNGLGLAGFAILLFNPADLFNVGFQLSFLTTLFLMLVNPLSWREHPSGRTPGWLTTGLAATGVAWVASELVLVPAFGQFSLSSLLVNPLAVAVFTWITAGACLSVFTFTFAPACVHAGVTWVNALLTRGLLRGIETGAAMPGGSWIVPEGWRLWVWLLFALAAAGMLGLQRRANARRETPGRK